LGKKRKKRKKKKRVQRYKPAKFLLLSVSDFPEEGAHDEGGG